MARAFGPLDTDALAPIDESVRYLDARQTYLDALPIAAAVVSRDFHLDAFNPAFAQLEASGMSLIERSGCALHVAAMLRGEGEARSFEWRDGGMIDGRHFTVALAPLCPSRDRGPRALITLVDRTIEVQTEKSLRSEMLSDSLTGLANRSGFVEHLEKQMAAEGTEHHAVVVVDLARFSRVNECVGALGGDELIITVARRLLSILRPHDLLARTGANEFAIVARIVDGPGDVLHVARRVEVMLTTPCRLSDFEIKVDAAIGCALAGYDEDAERLMGHAQAALKAAKRTGRVEFYRPGVLAAARRRFTIETELRRAIEGEALDMAFQPLINLATGRITGFEALTRWTHPDLGAVSPTEFIAVAEDSGLIVPLGRWALDRALKTLKEWDATAGRALPIHVAVNLSAIQVARDDIAAMVGEALRTHALPGGRLAVELTESMLVTEPDRAARALDAIKAVDAMVAMDDFGTGFSNLASLQKLPIDTLKIDRSFVSDMLGDRDKVAIVRAILGLAQALGMTTTAEGVETQATADTFAALGCTTGQGYLYAAPLAGDAALSFALASLG